MALPVGLSLVERGCKKKKKELSGLSTFNEASGFIFMLLMADYLAAAAAAAVTSLHAWFHSSDAIGYTNERGHANSAPCIHDSSRDFRPNMGIVSEILSHLYFASICLNKSEF